MKSINFLSCRYQPSLLCYTLRNKHLYTHTPCLVFILKATRKLKHGVKSKGLEQKETCIFVWRVI